MQMNAAIYCRVSTAEQTKNFSLPTQEETCRAFCRENGWKVVRVFKEGQSAKTEKTDHRPEFQKLIRYCSKHMNAVDFVIVYDFSRFFRNTIGHYEFVSVLKKCNILLKSATERTDDTPEGHFIEGIHVLRHQLDNETKGVKTKVGMSAAIERDRWPFRAPLGYDNPPEGCVGLLIDKQRAPLIREAFSLYATGRYSIREVRDQVNALGLRTKKGNTVSSQLLGYILRNPIYCGIMAVRNWGIEQKGVFQTIISKNLFDRVQALLHHKKATPTKSYRRLHPDFPLKQSVRCSECGTAFTASWSKGRNKPYPYYRCYKCNSINISKSNMEADFLQLLRSSKPKANVLRVFRQVVQKAHKERNVEEARNVTMLKTRQVEIEQRISTLEETYIYEQKIDDDTYKRQSAKLKRQLEAIAAEIEKRGRSDLELEPLLDFAQATLSHLDCMWEQGTAEQKIAIQRAVFPNGLTHDGERFGTVKTSYIFNALDADRVEYIKNGDPNGI